MARKLPGLTRVLGTTPIVSVAYSEIGASVYFALGIVALYAAGLTPWVLLGVGLVILLVTFSYAEASSALPEAGGAALFVARAFNDPVGFLTGWLLFLDYLIVIAIAGLFVPHYVGSAMGWEADDAGALGRRRRSVRHPRRGADSPRPTGPALRHSHRGGRARAPDPPPARRPRPRFRLLAERPCRCRPRHVAVVGRPRVLARARDARLHGPRDRREPRRRGARAREDLAAEPLRRHRPRRARYCGDRARLRVRPRRLGPSSRRRSLPSSTRWKAPSRPGPWTRCVSSSGSGAAVVLVAAITTAISGAGRLAYALGRHGMLPHAFARLSRRTLLSPARDPEHGRPRRGAPRRRRRRGAGHALPRAASTASGY